MNASRMVIVAGYGSLGRAVARRFKNLGWRVAVVTGLRSGLRAKRDGYEVLADMTEGFVAGFPAAVLCLPGDDAGRSVWSSVRHHQFPRRELTPTVVDLSTYSVDFVRTWLEPQCLRTGRMSLVCCTGGPERAAKGELIGFSQGTSREGDTNEIVSTLFQHVYEFDSYANAAAYKLVHNAGASIALVGLAEALRLSESLGLDVTDVARILSTWGWMAPVATSRADSMIDGREARKGAIATTSMLAKDVTYALEDLSSADPSLTLPILQETAQILNATCAREPYSDMSAVYRFYQREVEEE